MKKYLIIKITFLSILFIGFPHCKKKNNTNQSSVNSNTSNSNVISYPDSIYYGANVLKFQDSTILVNSKSYGLAANLQTNATLKIVITNLSPLNPTTPVANPKSVWFYSNITGWIDVNGYTNDIQTFIAKPGNNDIKIQFDNYYLFGKCRIDFFENGNIVTKSIYLRW